MAWYHTSGKKRPWSKLQRDIYKLLAPELDIQIHCVAYRMDSQRGRSDLPRYWVTLDKETIWDYPKNFLDEPVYPLYEGGGSFTVQEVYPYGGNIPDISALIREYIDTPKDEVLAKVFENDHWGLTDILKAADRRIGKARLLEFADSSASTAVKKIVGERFL